MDGPARETGASTKVGEVVARIEALRRRAGIASRGGPAATSPAAAPDEPDGGQEATVPRAAVEVEQARQAVERLRRQRQRRGGAVPIGTLLATIEGQNARIHRRLGALIELWEAEVPAALAVHTELTALRGGNLHVRAETSAVAFELDRLLREGLLARLRRQYAGPLTRVRIAVK